MKKEFVAPTLEISTFRVEDIITASVNLPAIDPGEGGLPGVTPPGW